MLMSNFLKNRKSTRDFKRKKLDEKTISQIKNLFAGIQAEAENKYFELILFEDGNKVFNSLKGTGGYEGLMIESPHYIGIRLKEVNDQAKIVASYYTEKLMGNLNNFNLGSCWLGIHEVDRNVRKEALGEENKNIGYLVALGYARPKNPFIIEEESSRLGVEELVFKNELGEIMDYTELENRGLDDLFYYVRFAPSTRNSQPWRFVLEKDRVVLYLSYIYDKVNFMDAGIISYYFEELAKTIGIEGKWELNKGQDVFHEDKKYKLVGEFKL